MRRFVSAIAIAIAAVLVSAGAGAVHQAGPWPGDSFDVMEKTIPELQDAMSEGKVTSRDLVEIYLARIAAYDRNGPRLNAMISLNPRALDEASALDRERASRGPRGRLHGIPVVVKDNFDMAGLPTTAGTLAFASLQPADDAAQVRKLKEAGAVIIGKTNLHELASGITTVSSLGGQTRNPYDPGRNAGGSSGGTGAAVAANFAAAGLGSDTCGSIRIPASHNALVGLRSTFGLSSRDGVVPLSHSQDVAGPLGRTVTDVAIMLDATAGFDPADATTAIGDGRKPDSYLALLDEGALAGARIGVLSSLFGESPEDNETGAVVRRALEEMKKLGAETIEISVAGLDEMLRSSSVIDAEFKFDLADYLATVPSPPVTSLAEIVDRGLYHSAIESSVKRRNAVENRETEQYRRARIRREAARQAVLAAFDEHRLDAIAYPTLRRKPARIGDAQSGSTCQLSASSGLPALSFPAGFTPDLLPVGIELLGRAFDEARLLSLAFAFEQKAPKRRPPFSTPALYGRTAPMPITFTSRIPVATKQGPASTGLTVAFRFDPLTGQLSYDASTSGIPADQVLAAWIHRGRPGEHGGAAFEILARGETKRSGAFELPRQDQEQLRAGGLYLAVYTRSSFKGGDRVQLALPGS